MMITFAEKWQAACQNSRLAIGIAPRLAQLPAPIARYDDPFLPFGRAVIEATADLAAAYVFDLASYFTLGAAGMRALERTIPLVPRHLLTVLHAPFITAAYAPGAFEEGFFVDAVTLATDEPSVIHAYTQSPQHGAFVLSAHPLTSLPNLGYYHTNSLILDDDRVGWITDPIIYASGTFDFEAKIRTAALEFHQQHLRSM